MRKLRTFVAALLLTPVLISNASAFSTDSDGALNPSRPRAEWCYFVWNGVVYYFDC